MKDRIFSFFFSNKKQYSPELRQRVDGVFVEEVAADVKSENEKKTNVSSGAKMILKKKLISSNPTPTAPATALSPDHQRDPLVIPSPVDQ